MAQHRHRFAVRDAASEVEHGDVLRRFRDQRHVMIDNKDGEALRCDALEQFVQVELFGRVEAGRGLVEQQQRRIGGERAGNLNQALMAVGEARDQFVGTRAEADEGERLHRALGQRGIAALADHGVAATLGADLDVFERGHRAEQADVLERAAEAGGGAQMWRLVGDVGAVEYDPARSRLVETGEHVQRRGLAGAVGSDQRMHAAAPHRHVDAVDRFQAAEIFREPGDLEHDVAADGRGF